MHNIIKMPFILVIRFYALFISPLLPGRCRFYPTCSAYAIQAIESHGVVRGLSLSLKRLLKCHPFCQCHWHDPVPSKRS